MLKPRPVAGRISIDVDDLLEAMTCAPDWEAHLNLATGEVHYGPLGFEEEAEDEQPPNATIVDIARVEGRREHRLMAEFADEVDEEDVREQLEIALAGRGAFGRFRQVMARHPDLGARWKRRREEWLLGEARAWLESLGVDADLVRTRASDPSPPPIQAPRRRGLRIGLVEILLLGAPGGKTELLDGKVYRFFRGRSADEARAIFKQVSRELCEFRGTAWRNRFIEGRNSFSIDGAEVRVEGNVVELTVEVSPELWREFSS